MRLPDGPRDIEALLVLPGERVLVVTKGRNDPVTVYRYPGALRPDTVTLEEVQRLSDGPRILPRQVTGGAVSRRGRGRGHSAPTSRSGSTGSSRTPWSPWRTGW